MNLPSKLLQQAYYTALNGQITYNGSPVPVYDVVPPGTDYPYIVLGPQTVVEENLNNDTRIMGVTAEVDVVTGFDGSFGGKSQANDIADAIVNRLRKTPGNYLSLSGFLIITTQLDSSLTLQEQTETHTLYVNKLRFRHKIQDT